MSSASRLRFFCGCISLRAIRLGLPLTHLVSRPRDTGEQFSYEVSEGLSLLRLSGVSRTEEGIGEQGTLSSFIFSEMGTFVIPAAIFLGDFGKTED